MMRLFGKKKEESKHVLKAAEPKEEHLENGELPWGWVIRNKEFVGKIQSEYTHFMNNWIDSRGKEPLKQYEALKSFILYLDDAERLCKSKGECFEFWFYEILASKDYIQKRKTELNELTKNFDEIETTYKSKQKALDGLENIVIERLKENDGVLQSEFVKQFDPVVKDDVSKLLYYWSKEGKIQRTKSGKSYILHIEKGLE